MRSVWRISMIILLVGAASASAQRAQPQRGARVSQRWPATAPSDGLDQLATKAAVDGKLKDFATTVGKQLEPLLAKPNDADLDRITRLAAFREFGRYFGQIEKLTAGQIETLQWLTAKPQLVTTLTLAVSEADSPERVLEVLDLLRIDEQDHLEEFPDLTTAMCVVWDEPARQAHASIAVDRQMKRTAVRPLMQYYINARRQLRFDPADLPWQLSAYLVDNLAAPDEISWAMDRYGGRKAIGNVFFDVPYDYEAYRGTSDLKLTGKKYTLENIVQLGGICGDQAYFASQVARSIGVPATIVTGKTSEVGEGHAWVGYLDVQGGRAEWNFEEGRYAIYQFWKGDVVDPQTREKITDADVCLLAELQNSSPRQRLASQALSKAADLLDPAKQGELYMQAINLCPGNRRAWMELSALAAQVRLDAKQTTALNAAVAKFALKLYPDFAFEILRRSISGRGTAQQIKSLDDMRSLFNNRPDIQAAIGLSLGDLQMKENHPNEALSAYGDVIERNTAVGPVVMEAMQRVDKMLRDANALPQLAAAYDVVWRRMPQPEATVIVQATPFYRIGERYEKLLEDLGDQNTARQVRARLDSLTQGVTVIRDRN